MSILNYILNKIRMDKNNKLIIDKTSSLKGCSIRIRGENNFIEFKKNVIIRNAKIEIRGENCNLIVGKETSIGENTYISVRENETKIIIGENCMFSRNSKIMTSDGHDILVDGKRINYAKDIIIGNNVWITDNVTILKGVKIGDGAVLAINSTVTKDVPSNSIVAGNPARIIKEGIEWRETLTF